MSSNEKLQFVIIGKHRNFRYNARQCNGGKTNYVNGKNNYVNYISVTTPSGTEKHFILNGNYQMEQLRRIVQQEINNFCDLKKSALEAC